MTQYSDKKKIFHSFSVLGFFSSGQQVHEIDGSVRESMMEEMKVLMVTGEFLITLI